MAVRSARLVALAVAWPLACGGARTSSSLDIEHGEGGASGRAPTTARAEWDYRSPEVDVDITLTTTESETACATSARLVIDEALSSSETYSLEGLSCEELRLSTAGDIVMLGFETGHDWSTEPLVVDTSAETIHLGPWISETADAGYAFALSAPECGSSCTCAKLVRSYGDQALTLPLGRRCD
jgi:hypothetical protein